MTLLLLRGDPTEWWALDLAGYLLAPLDHLLGVVPSELDSESAMSWIRTTELPWAPGRADLRSIPWDYIRGMSSDVELVDEVLSVACIEAEAGLTHDRALGGALGLVTRRRILLSTLESISGKPLSSNGSALDEPCADPHVHQGAALPLEVTLHWIARQMTSLGQSDDTQGHALNDLTGASFNPMPLMLALRGVLDDHPRWPQALVLAREAALNPTGDSWSALDALMSFSTTDSPSLDRDGIVKLKREALTEWDAERRVALLRLEAIMHGSIMQMEPGLDVFVRTFEGLASVRRRRIDKVMYYSRAIQTYVDSSPALRACEMRMGEPIYAVTQRDLSSLASEYLSALEGYLRFVGNKTKPARITFPLGLVKTRLDRPAPDHWRFDPGGIYDLVETLIDLLTVCPTLTRFVDGLDVCGEESDAPNWLFAPAYSRFAKWVAQRDRPTTMRFHAGEWQATPLHGLRRIAEFLMFDVPDGTPLRLGHGLALASADWSRLATQPVDELMDDLVWSYQLLQRENGSSVDLLRMIERSIVDFWPQVYPSHDLVPVEDAAKAYLKRQDRPTLCRTGFLSEDDEVLSFPDTPPISTPGSLERLLVAHLAKRPSPPPSVREAAVARFGSDSVEREMEVIRLMLINVYDLLAEEIQAELRWRGVVIEACLTSNVIVGGIRGYRRHPVRRLLANGGLVTFGTDDPSLFHAWTADELKAAREFVELRPRDVSRSQRLAVRIVAPGMSAAETPGLLNKAISELSAIARNG